MDNQTTKQKTQQHHHQCQLIKQQYGDNRLVQIGQCSPDAPEENISKQKQKMKKCHMSIDLTRNKKRIGVQKKNMNAKREEKRSKKGKHGSSCKGNLFNLLQKYTDNQLEKEKDQCKAENQNNQQSNNSTNNPTNKKSKTKLECAMRNKRSKSKTMSKEKSKCKNTEQPLFYLQESETANYAKRNLLTQDNLINQNIPMTERIIMKKKEVKKDIFDKNNIKDKANPAKIQGQITEKGIGMGKQKQKQGKVEGWNLSQNQSNKIARNNQNNRYEECKDIKKQEYGSIKMKNGQQIQKQKLKKNSINFNKRSCKSVISRNNLSQNSQDIHINSYIQNMCNNTKSKNVKNKIYNILKYEQTLKQLKQRIDKKYKNIKTNDKDNNIINSQNNHLNVDTQPNSNNYIQQIPIRLRKKAKSSYGYYNNCDSNADSHINSHINMSIITLSLNDNQNQPIQKEIIGRLNQHQSKKPDHPETNNFNDSKMHRNMNSKGKWIYVSSNVSSPANHCNISRIYNIEMERQGERQMNKDEQQRKERRLEQLRKNRKYKYHKSIQKQIKDPTKNRKNNSYLNLINIKNNLQTQNQDEFRNP